MTLFSTRRFLPTLLVGTALTVLPALVGCGGDDAADSESSDSQLAAQGSPEDPTRDIDVTEVTLPVFPKLEAQPLQEGVEIEDWTENEDGERVSLWRRRTVRTFSNFDPAHPERGGWELHGPIIEYYPNQQVLCTGQFEAGRMTGDWVWYYEDGKKSKEASYEDGVVSGTVTFWRPDGTLERIESYQHGQKHGRWANYAEDGESLLSEATFVDGVPHGVITDWYPSGNKKQEAHFEHGQLHGVRTSWYDVQEDSGQQHVASIEHYSEGKPHGRVQQWSRNGTQVLDVEYNEGERVQPEPEE